MSDSTGGVRVGIVSLIVSAISQARDVSGRSEEGASLIEYTLLLVLVAIVALVALHFFGGTVSNSLNNDIGSINNP